MKSKVKFPLIIYASWYLIILLFQIFLEPFYILTNESLSLYQRLYWSWVNYWDSAHYASIAAFGYKFPQQAFFPFLPLLIKIFSFVTGSTFLSSFILSIIFGLTTFILFYLLAAKLIGKQLARYALILFASFPSTMFLHAGYTEGLFLTLTLLSFLLMERKLYFLSALVAGFSTLTRLAGVGVLVIYLFLKQSFLKRFSLVVVSLTGLIAYAIFLQIMFGDWLLFVNAHKAWCGVQGRCQIVFPLLPLINYARLLLVGWTLPSLSQNFLDWFFAVVFLGLLIPVYRKFSLPYFIYALLMLFLPLSSGTTVGMVRYALVTFPVFFVTPQVFKSKILFLILCLLLFLLELRFVALFTNRIWVA